MRALAAALALAGVLLLLQAIEPAASRDFGQWENVDPAIRAWYRNAELTAQAQKRLFPNAAAHIKCCDHSDVVKTKFRVARTSGSDEWWWWNPEKVGADKWQKIPPDIIHWGETAPNKQPTLFVYQGRETCFFPGDGGI